MVTSTFFQSFFLWLLSFFKKLNIVLLDLSSPFLKYIEVAGNVRFYVTSILAYSQDTNTKVRTPGSVVPDLPFWRTCRGRNGAKRMNQIKSF